VTTKLIAILVGAVLLVGGFFGYGAWRESVGDKNGSNRVTVAWDADKAAIGKLAADTQAHNEAVLADTTVRNKGIIDVYQAKLSAAQSSAGVLASRLRDAEARLAASSRDVPQAGSNASTVAGAAPPSLGQLNEATGAALAECEAVRVGYIALIAEIRPQL
jgi:predicted negative regulator of RcsB-dependent stress response